MESIVIKVADRISNLHDPRSIELESGYSKRRKNGVKFFGGFAVDDLRRVYDEISDPYARRGAICIAVLDERSQKGVGLLAVKTAIIFMTATEPKIGATWGEAKQVFAAGYNAGPAAG